jgi:uncharacterized protein YndB with AHSA1/START domain
MAAQATQVYSVFVRATPEQVWEAITTPEFTEKYFYGARIEVHETYRRSRIGEFDWQDDVIEFDPPRRLVHRWVGGYDPELAAEDASRVTWELEDAGNGVTKLTVVHDELEASPKTAESVAGGWSYVLSGLKTLLETGTPLQS